MRLARLLVVVFTLTAVAAPHVEAARPRGANAAGKRSRRPSHESVIDRKALRRGATLRAPRSRTAASDRSRAGRRVDDARGSSVQKLPLSNRIRSGVKVIAKWTARALAYTAVGAVAVIFLAGLALGGLFIP